MKKTGKLVTASEVLLGGLLLGFGWRIRGTGGWGSSWGLLLCGFLFTLYVCVITGRAKKQSPFFLGLTALSFMLTVPSWGTLLHQITGVLFKDEFADMSKAAAFTYMSPAAGVFMMLCLGFGLASVFGIMLGRGISQKQWKIRDFVMLLAVFFVTGAIAKATIAHQILELVVPQAKQGFELGLSNAGISGDVHRIYMEHFDSLAWAKKIEGGRNYFSSIQAIASVIRGVCCLAVTRFAIRDKVAARTGFVVSAAFAFSITLSDLFFYFANGGYHMLSPVQYSESFNAWSCWEYFTGFGAGLIITAFVLLQNKCEDKREICFDRLPQKPRSIFSYVVFFAVFALNAVRPAIEKPEKDQGFYVPGIIIALVLCLGCVFLLCRLFLKDTRLLYTLSLGLTVLITALYYGCVGEEKALFGGFTYHNLLCLISVLCATAFIFVCAYRQLKESSPKKENATADSH